MSGNQVVLLMDGEEILGCALGVSSEHSEICVPLRPEPLSHKLTDDGFAGYFTPLMVQFCRTGVVFGAKGLYAVPLHVFQKVKEGEIRSPKLSPEPALYPMQVCGEKAGE